MPQEVFWDTAADATVRRGQWVIDNHPEASIEELRSFFALSDEETMKLIPKEEALCEDCPLAGTNYPLAARRWAFTPSTIVDPNAHPAKFNKNTALACLFRYRRENCNEPLPWSVTKEIPARVRK
jgi:hypothetical protein